MSTIVTTSYEDEAKLVLAQWRTRALTVILVVTMLVSIPSLITGTISGLKAGGGPGLFIMWAVYFILLVMAILQRIRHYIRVWVFLAAALIMSAISLWLAGLTGLGGIYLVIVPVYAFILAGERAGWITMVLSLLIFTGFTLFAGMGGVTRWPTVANPNSLDRWISAGVVGTMLMVIAVVLLQRFYRLQVNTLKAEREASAGLREAYDATLEGWAKALELRDHETEGHCRRVTELTLKVAQKLGVSGDLLNIYRGALLHDIGKMGIPDKILLKPAQLTEEERETMRRHVTYAYELLSPISFLQPSLDIPCSHHERWDGKGYPQGLSGEQIPLAARVFTVVDVWDALTSDRPYRKAIPVSEALAYVHEHAGTEFDPQVVKVFESVIKEQAIGN